MINVGQLKIHIYFGLIPPSIHLEPIALLVALYSAL